MNLENIEKITKLKRCAGGLKTFFDAYNKITSDVKCDKYDAVFNYDAFNGDERFSVFSLNLYFSAHTGSYGNSSCSTFENGITFDEANAAFIHAAFIHVMNKNKELIFKEMADYLDASARDLTKQAEKELLSLQELINSTKTVKKTGDENE